MKILQFVREMVPSFRRDDVAEKLRMLREQLEDQTIPVFEQLVGDGFAGKSKAAQDFERAFKKTVNTRFRGEWTEVTLEVLKNISANAPFFESLVEKNYSRDIVASGVTFRKAEILRLIALADFVTTYARQNLLYLLAAEGNLESHSLPNGKERPLPELKWLESNQNAFLRALNIMALKREELAEALDKVPEILINDESVITAEQTYGAVALDPFANNLLALNWNPFYWIGVRMANREKLRMDRAKNEKRALEFRIEQLRLRKQGQADAKLEKTIEFYEDEVNLLAAKIAKYEA